MNFATGTRRAILASSAMSIVLGMSGVAQAQAAKPADSTATLEEVVVTASTGTSIRGVEAVGAEVLKVDREAIVATGLPTPTEVLRTIPQVQGLGFDSSPRTAQNGNGNIQRGTSVSIRGLQSNATLILIDGHRIAPTGNVFSFTEPNQLPVSAIDRIDVVVDGASAIYGSDAVAGVVNFIPRKKFEGFEVSTRYRTNKFVDQPGAAVMAGANWEAIPRFLDGAGHVVAAFDYDQSSGMLRGESPYLRQDLRAFGGNDGRIASNVASSTAPGNIIVAGTRNTTLPSAGNFTYYGLPLSGPITAATLRLNDPNLFDTADFTDFMPRTRRYQGYLFLDQEITPDLTVYYWGYWNRRKSLLRSAPLSGVRTIPSTSPYYIRGIPGVANNAPLTVSFSFIGSIDQPVSKIQDDSYANTFGARYNMPKDWTGELSFTNSYDRLCANCIDPLGNNISAAVLQAELNNGNLNPFTAAPIPEAELAKFMLLGRDQSRSLLNDTLLRFDGPLFDLPTGKVRAAVGGEFQYATGHRTSRGIQATSDTVGAVAKRDVTSLYGELFIPLLGDDVTLPLVEKLLLDVALRTDKYSDFGRTTNPKVGATWEVGGGLKFNGTWGKAFRAPNLIENNPAFFSRVAISTIANAAADPALPVTNAATGQSNVVAVSGSNADLSPEKAESWSIGFDWRPDEIPGLQLGVTYYDINYSNQIIGLQTAAATFLANAANRTLYSPFITPAVQPAGCVNGNAATYNPAYQAALSRPTLTPIDQSNFCSAVAIIYTQNSNAASTKQDGFDFNLSYRVQTDGLGTFTPALNGTKIVHNKQALAPGAVLVDALDTVNNPISLRYRLSLAWNRDALSANLAMTHIGSYTNNLPITVNGVLRPQAKVPAWDTFDFSLTYRFQEGGWAVAEGIQATVTVLNLADKKPPTVLSANGGAFDQQTHNIFGRQWVFQLSKRF